MKRVLLTLTLSASLLLSPARAAEAVTFTDVAADAWYAPYVEACAQDGLMNGTGNNAFTPDGVMTLAEAITAADNAVIYPGEGGAEGCAVYGCLFVGKGAYGVVDLSEGTEVIVKPRGSSGTADPLDQRSSVGWKGIHAAAILYDEYMVRVECGSSYSGEDKAN